MGLRGLAGPGAPGCIAGRWLCSLLHSVHATRNAGRCNMQAGAGSQGRLQAHTHAAQEAARHLILGQIISWAGALTSSRILAITSGRSAMQWKVQVSTAAVVSCPAISSVMRSSRSCLEVMSSPAVAAGQWERHRL